jgi:YD repeat-containing protein
MAFVRPRGTDSAPALPIRLIRPRLKAMKTPVARALPIRTLTCFLALALFAKGVTALAGALPSLTPPIASTVDANGVDLIRGTLRTSGPPISIGSDENSLSGQYLGGLAVDSLQIQLHTYASNQSSAGVIDVSFGGKSYSFQSSGNLTWNPDAGQTYPGNTFTPVGAAQGTLVENLGANTLTYTAGDGTVVVFQRLVVYVPQTSLPNGSGPQTTVPAYSYEEGRALSVTKPNGETLTYSYFNYPGYGDPSTNVNVWSTQYGDWNANNYFYPSSIVSNYGYRITYYYGANNENPKNGNFAYLTTVFAVNLGGQTCLSMASTPGRCAMNPAQWAHLTIQTTPQNYAQNGGGITTTFTDPLNNTSSIYRGYGSIPIGMYNQCPLDVSESYTAPSGIATYLEGYESCYDYTKKFTAVNGAIWSYHYVRTFYSGRYQGQVTTTVTDPNGGTRVITSNVYDPTIQQVLSVKDSLGNVTNYSYDSAGRLSTVTYPEGNSTVYGYDARSNVTTVRQTAKPGSGLADKVTTASYDTTCLNWKTCDQPNYVIDAVGGRTDYTYSPDHGGVLTETGPADSNGVRPQTRYQYQQLYAKIVDNSGNLVNAATPIWKLTQVSTCKTATAANPASCVGTADETVTTYAYNSNNLLLTSQTVAAGDNSISATTNYAYDEYGNRTMIDGPRTDVDDRSYTTYDALRRPVYEIGVDSDGSGPLPRVIVHHLYDADGHESRTETGTGNATDGSDFVMTNYKAMTYDSSGNLVKTVVAQP